MTGHRFQLICRRNLLRLFWLFTLIPAVLFSVKCGSWDLQVSWSEVSTAISGNSSDVKILLIRHLLLPRSLGAIVLGVVLSMLARKPQFAGSRGNWLIFDASALTFAVNWLLTLTAVHTLIPLSVSILAVLGYLKLLKKIPFFFYGTVLLLCAFIWLPHNTGRTLPATLCGDLFYCRSEALSPCILLIFAAALADRFKKFSFLSDCAASLDIAALSGIAGAVPGISYLSKIKFIPPWWSVAMALLFFDTILRQFFQAPGAGLLLLTLGCGAALWEIRQKKIRTDATDAE